MTLDKKDRAILYELDKNARQPLTKIAKKVNLSRESVLYRVKKYFDAGIVRNYLTVIDMAKLGFVHYKIYVRLYSITEDQEKRLIKSLVENPFVSWVASCDGSYSLVYGIKARSVVELDSLIKEINRKHWKFIRDQDITTIIAGKHFYRDYLVDNKTPQQRVVFWGGGQGHFKLDEKDLVVLNELAKNSRAGAVEISQKTRSSPDLVINRIKRLEKSGIIAHYMLWSDVNKLKGVYYKVLVSLVNTSSSREDAIDKYCLNNPNIVYLVNSLGPWQAELDVEVEDVQEFRAVVRDFVNKFSDVVLDYTVLNIYDEYKFRFFEKGIF